MTTTSQEQAETFLGVAELADRWKVHPLTIYGWVRQGRLAPVRLNRLLRFPLSYVTEVEDSGSIGRPTEKAI